MMEKREFSELTVNKVSKIRLDSGEENLKT